ncbi:Usherin [Labeo rohita]|uniref:Usherin n=1 Tax=Labeo rohita TaxID=84645 RepID=A0ABQ8MQP8_LABRO|nr:Usherin [Labeo rohita]
MDQVLCSEVVLSVCLYRLSSTAACIFGVLLENESVVLKLQKGTKGDSNLICDLVQTLTEDEPDVVMNAAGAIASLVETASGRTWFLQIQSVLYQVLEILSVLLENERENTVNSAALILARLFLCEETCEKVLSYSSACKIFRCLTQCLSCSHKDTAMNAAFAVGRLCGSRQAKILILREAKEHQLVSRLQALLLSRSGVEMGQTVCFALSCLANDKDGHALLMESTSVPDLLDAVAEPRPRQYLVCCYLLSVSPSTGVELQEEVNMCLRRLKRLSKPPPVMITNLSSTSCTVSWETCEPESGLDVMYSLFDKDVMLYHGLLCQVIIPVSSKQSMEPLSLQLSLSTPDGDISPFSEPVVITPEQLDTRLKPPRELCVIGSTATQVRLCWIEPEEGAKPKSYQIYCNDTLVKTTTLLGATVSCLSPGTTYQLSVSSLGPGDTESPRAVTEVRTAEDQDHAPSALAVVVLGRHELQINWGAPVAPLGRLFKYELSLNGCVVYLGTERSYTARRLSTNTSYTCVVTAITSRGRCHSSPVTKKTARDEYLHSHRYLQSPSPQTISKHFTPSPSIQVISEIKQNDTVSPATLKSKVHLTMVPHRTLDLRKDRGVIKQPPVQIHSPKGIQCSNHTSKTDEQGPAFVFPVSSTDRLTVLNQEDSEYMFRSLTMSSMPCHPEDLRHFRARISPAEDVRLLQPVSFNWSNLKWTKLQQNRPQRDRYELCN